MADQDPVVNRSRTRRSRQHHEIFDEPIDFRIAQLVVVTDDQENSRTWRNIRNVAQVLEHTLELLDPERRVARARREHVHTGSRIVVPRLPFIRPNQHRLGGDPRVDRQPAQRRHERARRQGAIHGFRDGRAFIV